jgi:hypothetical protein
VEEIEAKSANISTERVWTAEEHRNGLCPNAGKPIWGQAESCANIAIRYRNVDVVYFRAIPYDWEAFSAKAP